MYGMYGKMGEGISPQNTVHYRTYRTLSDIPYTGKVISRRLPAREMTT